MLVAVSVAATALPLPLVASAALDRAIDHDLAVMNAIGTLVIWLSIADTIVAGGLVAVAIVRQPRTRRDEVLAGTLEVLAAATPMSVVLFFQFQFSGCAGSPAPHLAG